MGAININFSLNLEIEKVTPEETLTHLGYNERKDAYIEAILKSNKPVWVRTHTDFKPLCKELQTLFNNIAGKETYLILEIEAKCEGDFQDSDPDLKDYVQTGWDEREIESILIQLEHSEIEVKKELLEIFSQEFNDVLYKKRWQDL